MWIELELNVCCICHERLLYNISSEFVYIWIPCESPYVPLRMDWGGTEILKFGSDICMNTQSILKPVMAFK